MKVVQLFGSWGPWRYQACRDMDCLRRRSYGPIIAFFEPLVAGDQKASLANLSALFHLFRHLEGSLAWGPILLFGVSGT